MKHFVHFIYDIAIPRALWPSEVHLSGDGDLDLNTRLQADARLWEEKKSVDERVE